MEEDSRKVKSIRDQGKEEKKNVKEGKEKAKEEGEE